MVSVGFPSRVAVSAIASALLAFSCGQSAAPPPAPPKTPAPVASTSAVVPSPPSIPVLRPCRAGSPEHSAAQQAINAFDKHLHALGLAGDRVPLQDELDALLDGPCFALSGRETHSAWCDSVLSLKTFWERGGQGWLESALGLFGPSPSAFVPPTPRKTLNRESAPDHRLKRLLCSVTEPECGKETAGWAKRAALAFERHALAARLEQWSSATPPPTEASCLAAAQKEDKPYQYLRFRQCIASVPMERTALPLGNVAAPREGWLVLRGRRGHYASCNELRAYDLVTGAAYVARSCSPGIVLGGTPKKQEETVEVGRLAVDPLREAAWMMMLWPEAEEQVRLEGVAFAVPKSIEPMVPAKKGPGHGSGSSSWHSGMTTLSYGWVVGDQTAVEGTVTWPDSYHPAEDHAVTLLDIAETSFVAKGCAPAKLPSKLPLVNPKPDKDDIPDHLLTALIAAGKKPICH